MHHHHAIIWYLSVPPFVVWVWVGKWGGNVSMCLCLGWWMSLLLFTFFLLLLLSTEKWIYGIHSCGISAVASSIIVSNFVFAFVNWLQTFSASDGECKWIVLYDLLICGEVDMKWNDLISVALKQNQRPGCENVQKCSVCLFFINFSCILGYFSIPQCLLVYKTWRQNSSLTNLVLREWKQISWLMMIHHTPE